MATTSNTPEPSLHRTSRLGALSFEVVMANSQAVTRFEIDITPALMAGISATLDAGELEFCLFVDDDGEPTVLTLPVRETVELIQEQFEKANLIQEAPDGR